MFLKDPDEPSGLQKAIDDLLKEMEDVSAETPEYAKMADQLVKLYKLKEVDSKRKISPDTLATVLGNLIGIALIIRHERENVITSKALAFVQRLIQ